MYLLLLTLSISAPPIQFNDRPIEISIYVDKDKPQEKIFRRLLECGSSISIVNPEIIEQLGEDSIKQTCSQIDDRIKRIRTNFSFKFKDRYLSREKFGIQFGLKTIEEIPYMDLDSMLQMMEYIVDQYYYDKEFEFVQELRYKNDVDWVAEDISLRAIFVTKLISEGKLTLISIKHSYECDYFYIQNIFKDKDGKVKDLEDFGYIPKDKIVISMREKCESPIRILKEQ